MRAVSSQVFYNILIKKAEDIQSQVETQNYAEAFAFFLRVLPTEFALKTNWSPFPSYQDLKLKIGICETLDLLCLELYKLREKQITDSSEAIRLLKKLQAIGHLFNSINCAFKTEEYLKVTKKNIFKSAAALFGIPVIEPKQEIDCHGRIQISAAKDIAPPPLQHPKEYTQIMNLLHTFDAERLKAFCEILFENLETIEENSEKMDALKAGEENLFVLGEIQQVAHLSNLYKQYFKQSLEPDLEEPSEPEEPSLSSKRAF